MHSGRMAMFVVMAANCMAARLSPLADQAFERYVATVEARLEKQRARPETYLAVLNAEDTQRTRLEQQLMSGETKMEAVNGGTQQVDGALLHHWRAAAFVPNATPKGMLALLRDFNQFPRYYAPEVVSSRVLSDNGETATLALRLQEQRVLTIVLDSEYKVEAKLSGNDRGYSISRSTHFWQIDNPGTSRERRRREGEDDGFLWRLNSYWSFIRTREGLFMECEAVSLTRDVPTGLGWLILPIISDFPREKLEFTLRATKNALSVGEATR
jgi:hypothetical protein